MVAELAPQWGKFGHPSGQVRQRPILYSQTSVVGNAKGQEYVTTLTYHMDYPSWFFGIQIEQKFGLKCRIKLSDYRLAFWANLFVELLLG